MPRRWRNLHTNQVQRNLLHIETNTGKPRVLNCSLISMIIKKSRCLRKRFYHKNCNGTVHFIIPRFAAEQKGQPPNTTKNITFQTNRDLFLSNGYLYIRKQLLRYILRTKAQKNKHILHKNWSFPLRISAVNLTKSAVSCEFGHNYYRNPWWNTLLIVQWHILFR